MTNGAAEPESFDDLVKRQRERLPELQHEDTRRREQEAARHAAQRTHQQREHAEALLYEQTLALLQREIGVTVEAFRGLDYDVVLAVRWVGSASMGGHADSGVKHVKAWELGDGFALGYERKHFRRRYFLYQYNPSEWLGPNHNPIGVRVDWNPPFARVAARIQHLEKMRAVLALGVVRAGRRRRPEVLDVDVATPASSGPGQSARIHQEMAAIGEQRRTEEQQRQDHIEWMNSLHKEWLDSSAPDGSTIRDALAAFVEWAETWDVLKWPSWRVGTSVGDERGWFLGWAITNSSTSVDGVLDSGSSDVLFVQDTGESHWYPRKGADAGVPRDLPRITSYQWSVPVDVIEKWIATFVAATGHPWQLPESGQGLP